MFLHILILFLIDSTQAIDFCNPGFFGPRCSFPCHCLDNSCNSTTDSLGCISGSCSPGYIGFPTCQTACASGYFGLGCAFKCSCTPVNNCSHINGNCIPPNHCTDDTFGPGCQNVRAKLYYPPQLEAECSSIFVSWRPFNVSVDIGNADVREYRVELLSLSPGEVLESKTVSNDKLTGDIYREVFTNVKPGESYRAQVTPTFFVETYLDDGYLEDGMPSPLSETVYVPKEGELSFYFISYTVLSQPHGCHSNIVPFVTSDNSTNQTITVTNCPNILAFNNTAPHGGRLNGPHDCSLVGLSTNWAIFQWHHDSISCGLGDLVGYELSLADLGQDTGPANDQESNSLPPEEVIVKRYRTDTFSTSIVTQDLLPGTKYRAQIFAIYERGTVACSGIKMGDIESNIRITDGLGHFEFTTFKEIEAQSAPKVKIGVLERSSDRFGVRVQISEAEITEPVQIWVSALPMETRLPMPIYLSGRGANIQSAYGEMEHFSFASNIHPATRYRIYGWAVSASEQRFLGVTSEVWTSPKPFLAYPNFELPPPQILEVLDETIVVRFPNISGYEGGPITDYFMAIAPGNFSTLPSTTSLGDSLFILQRLSLPSTSRIVFHSRFIPHHNILIGDGAVEIEMNLPDSPLAQIYTDPRLEPDSSYTLFTVVVSSLEEDDIFKPGTEHSFVVSPTKTRIVRTLVSKPSSGALYTSVGTVVWIIILLLCFIALIIYIWWRFLRYRIPFCKKSKQYSLNMRPSRRMSEGSALTTIEDFMTALPRSYPAWSFPLNLRDPRFLVIDPQRGPDSNLLGSKGIHDIAETFFREYQSFSVNKPLSQTHAKQAVNRGKNRCFNSLPFDHNRVQLRRRSQFQTDYINASFVDGYIRRKAYICAQSPFNASTASDFWAMIDQCGVSQIISLDNLIEGGVVKCTKFWPDKNRSDVTGGYGDTLSGSERRQYDTLVVETEEVQEYANFTIRRFRLTDTTDGGENRITQFHYHRWRCQDADDSDSDYAYDRDENDLVNNFDLLAFLDFYIHIKMSAKMEDGPILVHCEDGLSRSSIFIAFDVLLQQLMRERSVTVGRTCASLRRARQNAIPTARHYALLYDLLFEVGIAGYSILDLDIRSTFASLNQRNVIAGFPYLKEQWYLLHNYSLLMSPRAFASPANVSITGENDHFIDKELSAVWVDGLTVRKDLLLVCAPRTNSALTAFWQFVFKRKISCIVNMEPSCFEPEGEAVPFWPPSSENPYEKSCDEETLFDIKYTPSAFTRAPKIGNVVDSEDETVRALADIDPWFQLGDLHIAQIGSVVALPPSISLSPRSGHRGTAVVNTLFKQKIIVRRLLPQSTYRSQHHYPIRAEFHTLEIFHFKAQWKFGCQVPPKGATIQALEVLRGCRGIGPTAVLCGDGATRSGLFVAAYLLTERLTRDRFLDLFHTLKALKLCRRKVILSVQQLRFLYRLLISWVDEVMTIRGPRRPPEYQEETSRTSSRTNYRGRPGSNMSKKHSIDEDKRSIGSESEDSDEDGLRASPPRPVNVLYHYYSEELSRLLAGRSVAFGRNFVKGRLEERFLV